MSGARRADGRCPGRRTTTLKTPSGRCSDEDLGHQQGRGRRGVRGLQHHGVAGGDGRCPLPHGHHGRVVPRGDGRAHPDGLATDHRRVVGHVLAGRLALEMTGGPGEEPDLVDHRGDLLRQGDGEGLAGVGALDRDELLGPGLDGVGDAEQRQAPLRRRGVPPPREGVGGGRHGGVHVLGPRHGGLEVRLTGARVEQRRRVAGLRLDVRATDEVRQSGGTQRNPPPHLTVASARRTAPPTGDRLPIRLSSWPKSADLTSDFRKLCVNCHGIRLFFPRNPR